MRSGKIILFIFAAVVMIFSFLLMWSAFDSSVEDWWLFVGIVGMFFGAILIFIGSRIKPAQNIGDQNFTLKIDLPGNVKMDTIKCQSCGAPISPENIKMVNGAPMVECPNCKTTYQITEEPKW
jgi:hypothetical protein